MRARIHYLMHACALCAAVLVASSCAKHIPAGVKSAEYQFPFEGKEKVEQQAYSVVLSKHFPASKDANPGIEQVHALNGHELTDSWSSGAFKQLLGPNTSNESRSFYYKVKDGPNVKVDAIVLDNKKLFFNYEEFQDWPAGRVSLKNPEALPRVAAETKK